MIDLVLVMALGAAVVVALSFYDEASFYREMWIREEKRGDYWRDEAFARSRELLEVAKSLPKRKTKRSR